MREEQPQERHCDLRMLLSRYSGVSTTYDAKGGIKQSFTLSGHIDDPYQNPIGDIQEFGPGDSVFDGKPICLDVYSPPDSDWLGWPKHIRDTPSISHACGLAAVTAGVEPEKFELFGETVEDAAVRVVLAVNADAFEAIRSQAAEAYDHRRILQAKVTLIGDTLPETDRPAVSPLKPKDLDVSKAQDYGVRGFEISGTRYFDHRRGRVLQVEPGREEAYGTTISVLLTEARYNVYVEHALFHAISCQGRVINGRGTPYDGADAAIEFDWFERNRHHELPERAYFGEFSYWVKVPNEEYSSTHFTFHLRHLREDAREFIIPMLTQALENEVILTINLTNGEEELLAVTDKLSGKVRHYNFKVGPRVRAVEDDEGRLINDDAGKGSVADDDTDRLTDVEAQSLAREWIDTRIPKPMGPSQTRSLMGDLARYCIAETLRNRENEDGLNNRLYEAWDIIHSAWYAAAPAYATKLRRDEDDQPDEEEANKIEDAQHVIWKRRDPIRALQEGFESDQYTAFDVEGIRDTITRYVERPWLRHPSLDWIFVDMLVSRKLCLLGEEVKKRTLPGKRDELFSIHHRYYKAKGNLEKMTEIDWGEFIETLHEKITKFVWGVILLPVGAIWAAFYFQYDRTAWVLVGVYALIISIYLIVKLFSWGRRVVRRLSGKPDPRFRPVKLWDEMYEVWRRLEGPVVNPTRVREAMVRSTEHGAVWDTITWSLVDKVIAIDPAVWVIWPSRRP
ncbi:MAG: hypothetical protein ACE5H7_16880 [Acidiferrobacterales bacterium]